MNLVAKGAEFEFAALQEPKVFAAMTTVLALVALLAGMPAKARSRRPPIRSSKALRPMRS